VPGADIDGLLAEQVRYYHARAPEYDDWWFRRGRHDEGPGANARWFREVEALEAALDRFHPAGDVLELACGTGLWTRRLARRANRLTAVDASPEVLALNASRVADGNVEYVQADLFDWSPPRRFDVCFFSFWLSHVPERRFDAFWRMVRTALRPGGRVFLIDSAQPGPASVASDGERMTRRLADGREFEIVKRFYGVTV
jgi:SAM-dependent methyltransferase